MKFAILPCLIFVGALLAQEAGAQSASKALEKGKPQTQDVDEIPGPPPQVQVTLEFIEVSQADATQLLYKDKLGMDGTKLRAALQSMVDSQKASMLETMMVVAKNGNKATTESIREVIYPTEYEEPELPGSFGTSKENQPSIAKAPRSSPLLPTAFDTRNTGSTLEIEPTVGNDESVIDLRIVPEIVFEAGVRKWNVHKDELGNESAVEMPYFYTIRTNSALMLKDGMPQLLSVLTPKSAEGTPDPSRKVLVIVTADVVTLNAKP